MNNEWRTEATAAIFCVVAIPLWIVFCIQTNVSSNFIVPILLLLVGLGCAIAGTRRGSRTSRAASWACISAFVMMIITVIILVVMLANTRFA